MPPFRRRAGPHPIGAVGIGLKATLKIRKLLILLNERSAKNTGFAQVRYTRGTRRRIDVSSIRLSPYPRRVPFFAKRFA